MRIMLLFIAGLVFLACSPPTLGEESFHYDNKDNRDPFVPLVTKDGRMLAALSPAKGAGDIKLEGIVWREGEEPVAVINGIIVKKGDIVDNFKVVNVEEKRIILLKDNEEFVIELIPEE